MSEAVIGGNRRRKGKKAAVSRRGAPRDALPDVQPPDAILQAGEDDEAVAENEEEDD